MSRLTYAERQSLAKEHERRVIEKLRRCNWYAEPFGSRLLSDQIRMVLSRLEKPLRWLGDIIATRTTGSLNEICLIDAKAADKCGTPNYSIEKKAVEVALTQQDAFEIPVRFVLHDYTVLRPEQINRYGVDRDGSSAKGSRKDFFLIEKIHSVPFEDIFLPSPLN